VRWLQVEMGVDLLHGLGVLLSYTSLMLGFSHPLCVQTYTSQTRSLASSIEVKGASLHVVHSS
jgi:hypothetical protein